MSHILCLWILLYLMNQALTILKYHLVYLHTGRYVDSIPKGTKKKYFFHTSILCLCIWWHLVNPFNDLFLRTAPRVRNRALQRHTTVHDSCLCDSLILDLLWLYFGMAVIGRKVVEHRGDMGEVVFWCQWSVLACYAWLVLDLRAGLSVRLGWQFRFDGPAGDGMS